MSFNTDKITKCYFSDYKELYMVTKYKFVKPVKDVGLYHSMYNRSGSPFKQVKRRFKRNFGVRL